MQVALEVINQNLDRTNMLSGERVSLAKLLAQCTPMQCSVTFDCVRMFEFPRFCVGVREGLATILRLMAVSHPPRIED